MNLPHAAGAALAGLTYIFVVKTIDTLWHGIFAPPLLTTVVVALNILAGLAQLIFYIQLFRQMTSPDGPALRFGAWLGILGSILSLLPKLLALAVLHQKPIFFFYLRQGAHLAAFGPWLAAVLLFICCAIFFFNIGPGREPDLRRAFGAGATGYGVMALVLSVVLVNHLSGVRIAWSAGQTGLSQLIFLSTALFTYLAVAYFYTRFMPRR